MTRGPAPSLSLLNLARRIAAGRSDHLGEFPVLPEGPLSAPHGSPHLPIASDGDARLDSVRLDLSTREGYWQRAPSPWQPGLTCPRGQSAPLTPEERDLWSAANLPRGATLPPGCPKNAEGTTVPLRLDPDRRMRFRGDLLKYPWRVFARIVAGSFQQSGVFIGPRHVLTCAHTLWNCLPGLGCGFMGLPIRVHFGPGDYSRIATDLIIPYTWWARGSAAGHNWDYALLIVAPDGHYSPGYFTLTPGTDRDITFTTSYGFPSPLMICRDAPSPSPRCAPWGPCGDHLYGMAMTAYARKRTYFSGPFNSQNGQSGAPFYRCIDGQRRVFGVLAGTLPDANGHYGQRALIKRFGPESAAQIAWWIQNCPRRC